MEKTAVNWHDVRMTVRKKQALINCIYFALALDFLPLKSL